MSKNYLVFHRFSLNVENGQVYAGRDCRIRLARPNSQAPTGTGKSLFSLLTTSRTGNLTVLIYSLVYVRTIDIFIH